MVVVIGVGRPWAFATAKAQTIGAEELIALVAPDGKLICIFATTVETVLRQKQALLILKQGS